MKLLVSTVPYQGRRDGVGHSEAIPRWGVGSRAALGLLSIIALLIPIALLAASAATPAGASTDSRVLAAGFGMILFHGLLVLFFVSFVGQNLRIDGQRPLWIAGLLFAAPITLPVYWWMHIWNAPFVGCHRIDDEVPDRVVGDQH